MPKKNLFTGDLLKTDKWEGPIIKGLEVYDAAAGEAVQDFIKNTFEQKVGYIIVPEGKEKYYCFADSDNYDLWKTDPEEYADLVIATFDAPAQYKAEINLISPLVVDILAGTLGNYIEYKFDIYSNDQSKQSTGEDVKVKYTFKNSGAVQTVTESYAYGTQVKFNVDNYLKNGTNIVNIELTGKNTETTTSIAVTYNQVAFTFSTNFDISKIQTQNSLELYYTMAGSGTKSLEYSIDGGTKIHNASDDITDNTGSKTIYIDIRTLNDGIHSIQLKGYITVNGKKYYSSLLYREFFVRRGTDKINGVMLSLDYDSDTEFITKGTPVRIPNLEQYLPYNLIFAAYHSNAAEQTKYPVNIYINNILQSTQSTENEVVYNYSFTPSITGNLVLSLNDRDFGVTVTPTSKDIKEITEGLVLSLKAQGKSNTDADRDVWTYGDYRATLTGFDWTENNGWDPENKRLVINNGAKVSVNYAPLDYVDGNNIRRTIEFEFGTTDVTDNDAIVCDMRNDEGKGLLITASEVRLVSKYNSFVTTRFKSDKTYRISLVLYPKTGVVNKGLVMLYVDGCICGATKYDVTDNFISDKKIVISGSSKAKVVLKDIRCYNVALSHDQILNNYIIYRDTIEEMNSVYDRNNIFNADKSGFSTDLLANQLPVLIITGDIPTFETYTSKKTPITVDFEYINMQDKTKSFRWEKVYMTPQGTSSMAYPIKNMRPYTQKSDDTVCYDWEGNKLTGKNRVYAFKAASGTQKDSQAVKCWTIKADFAESSGTHNTGVARHWNQCMRDSIIDNNYILRTEAQKAASTAGYNYDVRTTVDGFPIVAFYRLTASSELIFMGKYNFNNDKSTESVFGFCDIPGFNKGKINISEEEKGFYQYARTSDTESITSVETRFLAEVEAGTLPEKATTYILRANKTTATGVGYDTLIYNKVEGVWTKNTEDAINPVECWEILDSGNAFSLYQSVEGWDVKDTEGDPAWSKAFESRYPDIGTEQDTINLKRFCAWLVSTCINDTDSDEVAKQKLGKFIDEFDSHIDKYKMLAYYSYLMRFGAVDQTTKNAMLTSEDGQHWFFINYDNDTILGVRNDGLLKYGPEIDRQSIDPESGNYVYAGHASTLWNNIERYLGYLDKERFASVLAAKDPNGTFVKALSDVDNALTKAGLTYDKTIEMFNKKQASSWCERVYNQDAQFKYISPYTDPAEEKKQNYLNSLQGTRSAHREWWLDNRFTMYDSKWVSGNYINDALWFKCNQPTSITQSSFKIGAAKKLYYACRTNNTFVESGVLLDPNTEGMKDHVFNIKINLQIGTPVYIHPRSSVRVLDIAYDKNISSTISQFDLSGTLSNNMEELIMGREDSENIALPAGEFKGLSSCTMLKKLNIRNFKNLNTIDTGGFANLEELEARGSGLQTLTIKNSTIKNLYLPGLLTLELEGCKKMVNVVFEDITKLQTLTVKDCNYNFKDMVFGTDILVSTTINMTNIDWVVETSQALIDLKERRGNNLNITGKVFLNETLSKARIVELESIFPNCFSPNAPLYITAKDTIILRGDSEGYEGVDYQFETINLTGKEGTVVYAITGGLAGDSIDNSGKLHTSYKGVDRTIEVTTQFTYMDGTESRTCEDSKSILVKGRTYPGSLTIDGDLIITNKGDINYSLTGYEEYTGEIKNSTWTFTGDVDVERLISLVSPTTNSVIVRIGGIPVSDKVFKLKCSSVFDNGITIVSEKTIDLLAYIYPETINKISGKKRVNTSGTSEENYTPVYDVMKELITGPMSYSWSFEGSHTDAEIVSGYENVETTRIRFTNVDDTYKNATLKCTITLDDYPGGVKTLTASQVIVMQHEEYLITPASNPEILAICYNAGFCESPNGMYASECEAVEDIGQYFSLSKNIWFKPVSEGGLGLSMYKSFDEFRYFSGLYEMGVSAMHNDSGTCKSITLPFNIRTIDAMAFQGNFDIQFNLLDIPGTEYALTTVGSSAFYYCHETDFDFTLLPQLENVGSNAFGNCYNITKLDFSKCTNLSNLENKCFDMSQSAGTQNHLIDLLNTKVTFIPSEAFSCYNTTIERSDDGIKVYLPEGLTKIGTFGLLNKYINEIYCYAVAAPTLIGNVFTNTAGTIHLGDGLADVMKVRKLYVPHDSIGYDAWMTQLGDGWTLVDTL